MSSITPNSPLINFQNLNIPNNSKALTIPKKNQTQEKTASVLKVALVAGLLLYWNPLDIDYYANSRTAYRKTFSLMSYDMSLKPTHELLNYQESLNALNNTHDEFIPDIPDNLEKEQLGLLKFSYLPSLYVNEFFKDNAFKIKHFDTEEIQKSIFQGTLTALPTQSHPLPATRLSYIQLQELKISKLKQGQLDILFPQEWIDDILIKFLEYAFINNEYWKQVSLDYLNLFQKGKDLFSLINSDEVKKAYEQGLFETHHYLLFSDHQIKAIDPLDFYKKQSQNIY